jgi:DNA-binding NarL/FixJ family response regulator
MVCPVMVGRATQLAALRDLLDRAAGGAGRLVLVSGEAGAGKTRLVAEVVADAERRGFLCLRGACFQADAASPFAPVLDLLRAHFGDRPADSVADELGPAARELAPLLPELLPEPPGPPLPPAPDPTQARRRLFAALAQFLARAARDRPLLLVIEDVHWSDDASLELLHHLGRACPRHPWLLLATYRTDETHPGLRHWLTLLARDRLADELDLSPLARDDVDAMLRTAFGLARPVHTDFLDALFELTEGNPFFVEEVIAALVAAGELDLTDEAWARRPWSAAPLPRSVQDAVLGRAERLDEPARHLLRLAAVAGRRFDVDLLGELAGHDEARLLALLKGAVVAGLVVEETADIFAFRHALTRQAIYAELLGRERRALHGAIAEAIERRHAGAIEPRLADLAYHHSQASQWERALAFAGRAGRQALGLHAPRAAAQHFTQAIEAAARLALPPPADALRGRGQAREWVGDFDGARGDYEAAMAATRAAGDRRTEWRVALDLGLLWTGRDHEQSHAYYQQALDLARGLDDPATLAQSLNRMGNWYTNADRPEEGLRHHQEALAIFRRLDDRPGLAATHDLIATTGVIRGDVAQATASYRQAIALFEALDDRRGLASSLTILVACGGTAHTDTVAAALTRGEALAAGRRSIQLALDIGWRAGEAYARAFLASFLGVQGDYGQALPQAQAALAIADEIEHRAWMSVTRFVAGMIYLDLLALPQARRRFEEALALANELGSVYRRRTVAGFLASACIADGDLARAEAVLDATLGADEPARTIGQRPCWCARAELALARGEAGRALAIVGRLSAETPDAGGPDAPAIPRLAKLRGAALAALGRLDEAEAALLAARDGATRHGFRPLVWRLELALGQVYRAERRLPEADRAFAAARAVVDDLAAGVPDEALRQTFQRQADRLLPPIHAPSPHRAAKEASGGLTAREREVAALIARGLSNGEIADSLIIEKRTVESHVGNILAKAGCASRAQLVAWAIEHGLGRTAS